MAKVRTKDQWTRELRERAKAILLETSLIDGDGGELIGQDPRQLSAGQFDEAGIVGAPISAVIRAKCLDCCGEQAAEVRKCVAFSCPLWPYRMASNPFRTVNLTDAERERRSARAKAAFSARKAKNGDAPAAEEGDEPSE